MNMKQVCVPEKTKKLYKRYRIKFGFRILVLSAVIGICLLYPEELNVLKGMGFFQHFSSLHILWGLWLWYMLEKLLPCKSIKPRGCMKYRKTEFQPTEAYLEASEEWKKEYYNQKAKADKGAFIVWLAWMLVAVLLLLLRWWSILQERELLILSALFYVGDLVCILIWCPFRDVLMKNRCCTQCRIYNWDTMMLILPIVFIPGFFAYSLLSLALVNVGIWELTYRRHPERFLPISNENLQCRSCKGELGCIKYRQKES